MFFRRQRHKRIHIRSIKKDITSETEKIVKNLKILARSKLADKTETAYRHMLLIAEINSLIAQSLEQSEESIYLLSSLFLRDSFNLLNQREVESLHFVTGPEIGGIKVLDRIIDLELSHQTIVYAKADTEAVRKALIYLSQHNFKLLGYFHVHPGSGIFSNFPSSTDLALKELLKRGGYEALGGIFSRDGFIRFFSSKQFKIQIYGEGVEKINEQLYHLVEIS